MRLVLFCLSFCLSTLLWAAPLSFKKHASVNDIPQSLRALGGESLLNGNYLDDNDRPRQDKIFFTITHNYRSRMSAAELNQLLDPANGRVADIFRDPTTMQAIGGNRYSVHTQVDAVIRTLTVESRLRYQQTRQGLVTTHTYHSDEFSMFFHQVATMVEIDESQPTLSIRISQITAVKGSSWSKLQLVPFGERTLRRMVTDHARSFYSALRGIE